MSELNKSIEEKPQNEMDLKYEINKIIDKDQEMVKKFLIKRTLMKIKKV